MKKLIYMGMGLLLSLSSCLFMGCEKNKESEVETESDSLNADEVIADLEASMVYVEGGTFMMGATPEQGDNPRNDDEKPVHEVTIDGFYIGKYEITQAQWKAVMGTTIEQQYDTAAEKENEGTNGLPGVGNRYPMYYVSWKEAQEFCEKLSVQTGKKYRLPTEAEWEYAARGGQKADGAKYAGSDNFGEVAWFGENSYGDNGNTYGTHPVGQKKPNGLGIYDMSGNVSEWCSDWYDAEYYKSSPSINPQGPSNGTRRVVRGGEWSYTYEGQYLSSRGRLTPNTWFTSMGFRVVCER